MTTIEIPSQPTPPTVNPFADRLWRRLPVAYRDFDALNDYAFLLYIDAVTQLPGEWHTVIERIAGARAAGPALPEPWSAGPDELTRWREAKRTALSALGDPLTADPEWLPWLAQFVGARVDWTSDVPTRRNAVRYAVSGWQAGTRPSIEYAARPVLIGSQYARCVARMRADEIPPGPWDVAIITRSSETPDPGAVLASIAAAGVKPAGVVLHHRPYAVSWNVLAARRPIWNMWTVDAQGPVTWNRLAETGLTYADVPGNLLENSSFEDGLTDWTAGTNTTQTLGVGGLDGQAHAVLTATGAGDVEQHTTDPVAVNDLTDYRVAVTVNPFGVERIMRIAATFDTGPAYTGSDVTSDIDGWGNRLVAIITAPSGSTEFTVSVQVDGLGASETVGVDAWDAREFHG